MKRSQQIALLSCACLLSMSGVLNGAQPLRMQVSPAVSRAPAVLTVRVSIEAAPRDRAIEIVAESSQFYRSALIQVDGAQGAAVNEVQFRDLPSGFYEVTAVLVGVDGPRAKVARIAKVEPAVGSGH
jgi:hypothetical protein